MTEMRANWEPERGLLGWTRTPEERTCHLCRRGRMHTQAEHDLVYPVDQQTQLDWEREEEHRQAKADKELMARFMADGMTEEQAIDELWRWMAQGRGLVEQRPRP